MIFRLHIDFSTETDMIQWIENSKEHDLVQKGVGIAKLAISEDGVTEHKLTNPKNPIPSLRLVKS